MCRPNPEMYEVSLFLIRQTSTEASQRAPRSLLIVFKAYCEVGVRIQDGGAKSLDHGHPQLVSVKDTYPLLRGFKSKWWELPTRPSLKGWWKCVSGNHHLIAQVAEAN
jgi:hypothetical protein